MNKLTAKQLLNINAKITNQKPLLFESEKELLDSITRAPYQQDKHLYYIYKTVSAKAAKLGCEIVKKKPFKNENEMTAIIAILTMMEVNGTKLYGYKDDLESLRSYLRSDQVDKVEEWLDSHKVY